MKLKLENARINTPYQKVNVYNARGVTEARDILTLTYIDEDTNERYTIARLIEKLYEENKNLKDELKEVKDDYTKLEQKFNETEKINIDLVEALRKETREKGIL